MPPFLSLHAVAANRGDGLHPELLALFRRVAADANTTANAGMQEITAPSIAPSRLNQTDIQSPSTEQLRRRRR
jgi:hypothetical protein